MTAASAITFVKGFVQDPKSCDGSSARLCAIACVATACVVALVAALRGQINMWTAGVITALLAGVWAALNNRTTTVEAADSAGGAGCPTGEHRDNH